MEVLRGQRREPEDGREKDAVEQVEGKRKSDDRVNSNVFAMSTIMTPVKYTSSNRHSPHPQRYAVCARSAGNPSASSIKVNYP